MIHQQNLKTNIKKTIQDKDIDLVGNNYNTKMEEDPEETTILSYCLYYATSSMKAKVTAYKQQQQIPIHQQ
jgi:hypothetical protein